MTVVLLLKILSECQDALVLVVYSKLHSINQPLITQPNMKNIRVSHVRRVKIIVNICQARTELTKNTRYR